MESRTIISIFDFLPMWATIVPIIICSIIALAVIIERFIFFKRNGHDYSLIVANVTDFIRAEQLDKAKILSERYSGVIINIIKGILNNLDPAEKERIIIETSENAVNRIEKNISILATVATISPMFGLFGTVTGMMKSFSALSSAGPAANNLLAYGIAEALITTALGLIVAIPSWIFYNYLITKVEYLIKEAERVANSLMNIG